MHVNLKSSVALQSSSFQMCFSQNGLKAQKHFCTPSTQNIGFYHFTLTDKNKLSVLLVGLLINLQGLTNILQFYNATEYI